MKLVSKVMFAAAAVLLLCASGTGDGAQAHRQQPHVVNQEQRDGFRYIYIHNTLARPIWAYIECEQHLTVTPIGIPGNRVGEVVLPDIEPDEKCLLNHYRVQVEGEDPPAWIPSNQYGSDSQ